ncbi:non-oxidative hydroxyarylic acid decarboxylases subunit D [Telmatobacter bradus]|uniref:non-oxidative hydroxyarylic acid decarboxylases subunit D n=1 Tax=Telmatobacter bradus TaxID=474953 RepID=UPI003B434A95
MANNASALPVCPRCESHKTEIVTKSPVEGVWEVYNCPVCFYSWRSTEPEYATSVEHYNPHFKIRPEDIPHFIVVPSIPARRVTK